MDDAALTAAIRHAAVPFDDGRAYEAVVDEIGDAEIVLLGESTHGTHEFYRARAEITRRLLRHKGFAAVAVECDWPDALLVDRFILSDHPVSSIAESALGGFRRFPRWMWRNTDVLNLAGWLREFNADWPYPKKIRFHGLDLYSLRASMEAVAAYLDKADPEAALRARARYACFDHMADDPQRYGFAAAFGMREDCQREVTRQLMAMAAHVATHALDDDMPASDKAFHALQHARVAQNAEAYYRKMFEGRNESWNVRDTHMADTLDALREHLGRTRGAPAKIVVWAHNSHIGDARATEMGERGQTNLGCLARERYGEGNVFLLGFTTASGSVAAASEWDGPVEIKEVLPARRDSYEHLFHAADPGRFFLPLRRYPEIARALHAKRLERAIGVVYLPDTERISHYFHADLAGQFDAVMHIDETRAVKPLDGVPSLEHRDLPETYPSGI